MHKKKREKVEAPAGLYTIRSRGLVLAVNLAQASAPIMYLADDGTWQSTPYQTANARHMDAEAFRLVRRWFRNQGW